MLEWFAPKYISFILLPPREQCPVWYYNEWHEKVVPVVGEMLALLKKDYSLHSLQGPAETAKTVKFGRLRWNDESHQKWTLNSQVTKGKRDNWSFELFCIYSPPRHKLIKSTNIAVDFYFEVHPMGWSYENSYAWVENVQAQYHQALLVVIRKKMFRENAAVFMDKIKQLSSNLMAAPTYMAAKRIWKSSCFEDIYHEEFVYFGGHKDKLPDLKKTKRGWKRIR